MDNEGYAQGEVYLSVLSPAYNEERNIEIVIRNWAETLEGMGIQYEILIVNDGSTDKTGTILQDLETEFSRLKVISYLRNMGYGYALSRAIPEAKGRWIVTLDSDGQFDIGDVRKLLEYQKTADYDIVTGYRIKKQDRPLRVFANRCLNSLIQFLFSLRLRDTNCALKLYRAEVLRGLRIEARGYPTPTEIMIRTYESGYTIGEVGVKHRKRAGGTSKIHTFKTGWQMLLFFLYMRMKLWLFSKQIIREF